MAIYHKNKTVVTKEMIVSANLNDEFFYRQMAVKLIKEMPLDALQKLFKFEKFDPFSDESTKVLEDTYAPDWHKERIVRFRQMGQLEFEASVTIG